MKRTIFSCVLTVFVIVTLVKKGTTQETPQRINKYFVTYLSRMDKVSKDELGLDENSKAKLSTKETPQLIDMAITGLKKDLTVGRGSTNAERAALIRQHIQFFTALKERFYKAVRENINNPTNETIEEGEQDWLHTVESVADYDNKVKNSGTKIVLTEFYANWSEPCKYLAPYLNTFAQKYISQIIIIKVDVDVQKELAEQYGLVGKWSDRVSQVPTFVFIRNGRTIIRFTGTDPNKVENTIKAMLNPSSNIIVPIYDFLNPIN